MSTNEKEVMQGEEVPKISGYGARLLECRKFLKMTMVQFGEACDVSKSAISLYEKEQRFPRIETVVKMSELSGFSVDYLLGLSDVKHVLKEEEIADVHRVFDSNQLNWDGRPLDPGDLAAVRHLLETIVHSKYRNIV